METVRTHCYDCDATLFKNGTDLTYHRTLADQITNVMCPSCGAYFDRDFYDG
jgi:RNase P subunit RPR2